MTTAEINAEYKRRFSFYSTRLSRTLLPSDKEYVELHDWFKGQWVVGRGEDEEVGAGAAARVDAAAARAGDKAAATPARARGAVDVAREQAVEPLSGPGVNHPATRAESSPGAANARRGAAGGLVRVCVLCGEEWERSRTRGRPSSLCDKCRKRDHER